MLDFRTSARSLIAQRYKKRALQQRTRQQSTRAARKRENNSVYGLAECAMQMCDGQAGGNGDSTGNRKQQRQWETSFPSHLSLPDDEEVDAVAGGHEALGVQHQSLVHTRLVGLKRSREQS